MRKGQKTERETGLCISFLSLDIQNLHLELLLSTEPLSSICLLGQHVLSLTDISSNRDIMYFHMSELFLTFYSDTVNGDKSEAVSGKMPSLSPFPLEISSLKAPHYSSPILLTSVFPCHLSAWHLRAMEEHQPRCPDT